MLKNVLKILEIEIHTWKLNVLVGFFIGPTVSVTSKNCETGPTFCIPYPRKLKRLTIADGVTSQHFLLSCY